MEVGNAYCRYSGFLRNLDYTTIFSKILNEINSTIFDQNTQCLVRFSIYKLHKNNKPPINYLILVYASAFFAAASSSWRFISFTNVCETINGNTILASTLTFTGLASILILPQETASSGDAPESDPSNSYRNIGIKVQVNSRYSI